MRYDSAIFMKSAYIQGSSFLHKLKAGYKLAALLFIVTFLYLWPYQIIALSVTYGFFTFLVFANRLPWQIIIAYMRPFFIFLAYITLAFAFFQSWQMALFYGLRIIIMIAFSTLLLLTTTTIEMQDFLFKLFQILKYIRINPQYPTMAVILTLRAVPQIGGVIESLVEARKARGLKARRYLIILPAIIQIIIIAKNLSTALEARGWPMEKDEKPYE